MKGRSKSGDYQEERREIFGSKEDQDVVTQMTVSGVGGDQLARELRQKLKQQKKETDAQETDAQEDSGFDLLGAMMWVSAIILFLFLFRALSAMEHDDTGETEEEF
jgi:hypothetical protein